MLQHGVDFSEHTPVDALHSVPVDAGSFRQGKRARVEIPFSAPPLDWRKLFAGGLERSLRSPLALSNPNHDPQTGRFAAVLSGEELGKGLTDNEYRDAAEGYMRKNLQGKTFENADTGKQILWVAAASARSSIAAPMLRGRKWFRRFQE